MSSKILDLNILKRSMYPLFILAVAYVLFLSNDAKIIIAGIAVFLIGMVFMEDGFKLFSGGMLERVLEKSTSSVPRAIGTGFLATAIIQSSSLLTIIVISFLSAELISLSGAIGIVFGSNIGTTATAWIVSSFGVIIITAVATGQIEYINALSLAIGANIGTTVTAIIGSLSSNFNGKRLAIAHFIFNIVTGFIAIVFLYHLADIVDFLALKLTIADDDYAMKLALFYTIFNVIGVLVVAPFTAKMVVFLQGLFKEKRQNISRARYLDKVVVEVPEAAILALKKEIIHLYDNSTEAISHALSLHRHIYIGMGKEITTVVESSVIQLDINIDEQENICLQHSIKVN